MIGNASVTVNPCKTVLFFCFNTLIEGLRGENVVHCTDCEAHRGYNDCDFWLYE